MEQGAKLGPHGLGPPIPQRNVLVRVAAAPGLRFEALSAEFGLSMNKSMLELLLRQQRTMSRSFSEAVASSEPSIASFWARHGHCSLACGRAQIPDPA